jgi:hypothetical protein
LKKIRFLIGSLLALGLMFSGCGSGSSSEDSDSETVATTTTNSVTGKIVDAPIENLWYKCSSGKASQTNSSGEYSCNEGDNVTFYLNNSDIATVPASSDTLTPYDLFPNNIIAAINFASLVQTIDDNTSIDTIVLDMSLVEKLPDSINFNDVNFTSIIEQSINKTLVNSSVAQENMNNYIQGIGLDIPQDAISTTRETIAVIVDTNVTRNIVTPLNIVADTQVVSTEDSALESVSVSMEENTSVIVAAVNTINEPVLVGRKNADSQTVELSYESTAELFTLRTKYFYGLTITDEAELSKRVRSHSKFPALVAELKGNIEGGSSCPLDHQCSYYASIIANSIAQDINTSDIATGGN